MIRGYLKGINQIEVLFLRQYSSSILRFLPVLTTEDVTGRTEAFTILSRQDRIITILDPVSPGLF
jgi:hypothetical protein